MSDYVSIPRRLLSEKMKEISSTLGDCILDVGAGDSPYKKFIKSKKYIALDISFRPNVHIIADATKLPFKDGVFSDVLCIETLHHLKQPRAFLEEALRTLRSGGQLFITTRFFYPHTKKILDYFRFSKDFFEDVFKKPSYLKIQPEGGVFLAIAEMIRRMSFKNHLLPLVDILLTPVLLFLDKRTNFREWTTGYYILFKKR